MSNAASILSTPAVPSTVVVNSTSSLVKAINNASSGETIELAPGTYQVNLTNPTNHGGVTIMSEDASNKAVIDWVDIHDGNNINFNEINFDGSTIGSNSISSIYNSSNITFENSNFHGAADTTLANSPTYALVFHNDQSVSVTNSSFQNLHNGIVEYNGNGFDASGNDFNQIFDDGIDNTASVNVTISNNSFTNFHMYAPDPGHPDAIQFFTSGTTVPSQNILISGNSINTTIQGIFLRDEVGGLTYTNVKIIDNNLQHTMGNGIYLVDGANVTVASNSILYTNQATMSQIVLADVSNAIVSNDSAWQGSFENIKGLLLSSNTFKYTSVGSAKITYLGPSTVAGVPDVGAWMMLLLGFSIIGGVIRGRRVRRTSRKPHAVSRAKSLTRKVTPAPVV